MCGMIHNCCSRKLKTKVKQLGKQWRCSCTLGVAHMLGKYLTQTVSFNSKGRFCERTVPSC